MTAIRVVDKYVDLSDVPSGSYSPTQINSILTDLLVCCSASNSSSMQVYDEGVLVMSSVGELNFIGASVMALAGGGNRVNVYIPPPSWKSHWNKNDGSNGAQFVVESLTRVTTHISTPTSEGVPFKTSGWAGTNQATHTTNTSVFTLTTPSQTTGFGGTSTFTVRVLDADNVTPIKLFTTPSLTANGNYINGDGTVIVNLSSYGADATRMSAKAIVSIDIGTILSGSGKYSVQVTHSVDPGTDPTGDHVYAGTPIFYDSNQTTPTIGALTFSETQNHIVTRYLSGIQYYTIGSQFTVGVDAINRLNDRTAKVDSNLVLNGAEYGLPTLTHSPFGTGAGFFSGWTNAYDNVSASYSNSTWAITATNFRYIGPTANVSGYGQDPWNVSSTSNSANANVLIDTYGISSTNLFDDFNDENRRQDSSFNSGSTTGNWDSVAWLSGTSGLVFNSRLMVPNKSTYVRSDGANTANANWTTYYPMVSGSNPDYSSLSGSIDYYRTFPESSGLDRSSFTIVFAGTFTSGSATADLAAGALEIYIRKRAGLGYAVGPSTANTLKLHGAVYNFSTFDDGVTNGQCRELTSSGNTVNGTFGGFSMRDGLFVQFRIINPNTQLDSVTFTYY